MGFVVFAVSVAGFAGILSFIDVDTITSSAKTPDYHFVPFGGDAFGA